MKSKIIKVTTVLLLITIHIFWLVKAKSYVTPELIFPIWLLSNAGTFVSEIQSFYPPALFYLVSSMNNIASNFLLSVNLTQLTIVLIIDVLLFYYLRKNFNFKFAIIGMTFYIPWQVFFRGNYLWFDLPTIPFIAVSFFFFIKFVSKLDKNNLFFASLFLSLGYFFKNTILWIYILYFGWIVYLSIKEKNEFRGLFGRLMILFIPLILALTVNFLILLLKSTPEFTLYWSILMQNFIYPRMSTSPRSITPEYYPVLALIFAFFLVSSLIIEKFSKKPKNEKWFLYTFTLVSFANVFPRWSDFHVQPFLFFLTIAFTFALYLRSRLKKDQKLYHTTFLLVALFFSLLIFANRIITELKNKNISSQNYIAEFAPEQQTNKILGKNVFVYDFPLYNNPSPKTDFNLNFFEKVNLAIRDPEKYYRQTNSQVALNYVRAQNPDIIIIPYQIRDRLASEEKLTDLEKHILEKYHSESEISKTYFIYSRNHN